MKQRLLFLVFLFVPIYLQAQMYFTDGTIWKTETRGSTTPEGTVGCETVTLKGDTIVDGYNAYKMYTSYDNGDKNVLLAVIRTDNDKVLYKREFDDNWYLMYDFGLKPGDGCYVYDIHVNNGKTYMKCTHISKDENNPDFDIMYLEEYESEKCDDLSGKGIWIKVLSGTNGVLYNNRFDLDGLSTTLLYVARDNGQVIYSSATNGVYNVKGDNVTVSVTGKDVYISGVSDNEQILLMTCDGVVVQALSAVGGEAKAVLMDKGVYMIKTKKLTRKIRID